MLRPGGRFVAFDPNRMNPFMYLYRDRSSPFYSPVGVTAERAAGARARDRRACSARPAFASETDISSNLRYRYRRIRPCALAAAGLQCVDAALFAPGFMRRFRAFVLTSEKSLEHRRPPPARTRQNSRSARPPTSPSSAAPATSACRWCCRSPPRASPSTSTISTRETLDTLRAGQLPFIEYGAADLLTQALADKRLALHQHRPSEISTKPAR